MDYKGALSAFFQKFGQVIQIKYTNGTQKTGKAIMMPLLYKNKLYVELQPSEVGKIDEGCYQYIGDADLVFSTDDIVVFAGKRYVTERFERIYYGTQPFYCWAVLRPCIVKE